MHFIAALTGIVGGKRMKETDSRGSSPEENCGGLKVRPRSRCSYRKIC